MTYLAHIFLLLLFSPLLLAKPLTEVVVDLDGVILLNPDPGAGLDQAGHLRILGRNYRVADGAPEFIDSLAHDPRIRVSFFSAYRIPERNIQALKSIKLPSGQSAFDAVNGRVFSGDRLSQTSLHFEGYKNLLTVNPKADLENTILVDDNPMYVFPGQEKNLLWVPFGDSARSLVVVRGLIEQSMTSAEEQNSSVTSVLQRLQWSNLHGREKYNASLQQDEKLLDLGVDVFKKSNPSYILPEEVFKEAENCRDLFKEVPTSFRGVFRR